LVFWGPLLLVLKGWKGWEGLTYAGDGMVAGGIFELYLTERAGLFPSESAFSTSYGHLKENICLLHMEVILMPLN